MRDRIAEVLGQAGLFVASSTFEYEEIATLQHSRVARVRIASGDSPVRQVIFKEPTNAADTSTIREGRFYRLISPWLPPGSVPECYSAAFQDDPTLLLEDLDTTHRPASAGCPTRNEAIAFVIALAEVHATGFLRPSLESDWAAAFGDLPGSRIKDRLTWIALGCEPFLASLNDADDWTIQLMMRIGKAVPDLIGESHPQTILHGDAHYWNGLYSSGTAALLDWGNTCLGPPGVDLAHAIALNLPPAKRVEWEELLLKVYVERLEMRGVPARQADVWQQYRLGVLYALVVPISYWAMGIPWLGLFGNVKAAARELGVDALV